MSARHLTVVETRPRLLPHTITALAAIGITPEHLEESGAQALLGLHRSLTAGRAIALERQQRAEHLEVAFEQLLDAVGLLAESVDLLLQPTQPAVDAAEELPELDAGLGLGVREQVSRWRVVEGGPVEVVRSRLAHVRSLIAAARAVKDGA